MFLKAVLTFLAAGALSVNALSSPVASQGVSFPDRSLLHTTTYLITMSGLYERERSPEPLGVNPVYLLNGKTTPVMNHIPNAEPG